MLPPDSHTKENTSKWPTMEKKLDFNIWQYIITPSHQAQTSNLILKMMQRCKNTIHHLKKQKRIMTHLKAATCDLYTFHTHNLSTNRPIQGGETMALATYNITAPFPSPLTEQNKSKYMTPVTWFVYFPHTTFVEAAWLGGETATMATQTVPVPSL